MKTLDPTEFFVLEICADLHGAIKRGPTDSEREAAVRLFRRGLVAYVAVDWSVTGGIVEATPLGREALRIAKAVRALEGQS